MIIYKLKCFYFNSINVSGYDLKPYKYDKIIPFNLEYKLYTIDYYTNSPYNFYDFYNTEIKKLDCFTMKKINTNPRVNNPNLYNINKDIGNKVTTMILPYKSDVIINELKSKYKLAYIYTYNNTDEYVEKELFINYRLINQQKDIKSDKFYFIAYEVIQSNLYNIIKWIPVLEIKIEYNKYFEIDVSEFGDKVELYFEHNL